MDGISQGMYYYYCGGAGHGITNIYRMEEETEREGINAVDGSWMDGKKGEGGGTRYDDNKEETHTYSHFGGRASSVAPF